MATRCTIKIEGVYNVKIYKHFDGYPAATLPWLQDFNQKFMENRGIDSSYKFAQLLRSSVRDAEKYPLLDQSKYTGWGVIGYHDKGDEAYEYTLLNNGEVSYIEIP